MEMFNQKSMSERIGDEIKKSTSLSHLKEVEKYVINAIKKHRIEVSYDVIANEIPFFKTFNYTEWAHSFIIHPLQQELRMKQMRDAYLDNAPQTVDFVEYFKDRITSKKSNKYSHIHKDTVHKPRDVLVVLVGSNKLKDRICLNKLRWIRDTYDDDVYFKPHPLTKHQLVGELKDLFGDAHVLHRDADMYEFLLSAKIVFTSHMSESAVYTVCLDKQIEPIDVYNKVEQGSFYHINHFLFTEENPKEWINRTFNSPKCGVINPEIEPNWKQKVDQYLEYITGVRNKFKNKYLSK